ncbi:MAG TPA: hypothetical protein PKX92_04465 [Edaphocola sp.]|nr:hypothetical protein [Edaphocola sp.]
MKKKIITGFGALILIATLTQNSNAQKLSKKMSFGFGFEAGLPIGDLKNGYNFAGELTVRGSYHLGPGFITLTAGSLVWVPKIIDEDHLNLGVHVPIKAGYKFIYKKHLFAMGEIGYNSFKTITVINGQPISNSQSGLVFAPGIGFQNNALEIGVRYEMFPLKMATGSMLAFRLGFNF